MRWAEWSDALRRTMGPAIASREGIAAVEFVIVLPVVTVLLLGPIEIGRLEYHFDIAADGVRDAVRYLSQVPVDCSGGPGSTGSFVDPVDATRAENLAKTGTINDPVADSDYLLTAWNDANTTFAPTIDCVDNAVLALSGHYAGCDVVPTVTIDVNFRFTFLSSLPYLPVNLDLPIGHSEVNVSDKSVIPSC